MKAQPCKLSDLVVTQTTIPSAVVKGDMKNKVTVENWCVYTQANIKLSCSGFSSSAGIDRDMLYMLSVDGDSKVCTLNGGLPIGMGPDYAVKFSYMATSQFSFNPMSSTIACS